MRRKSKTTTSEDDNYGVFGFTFTRSANSFNKCARVSVVSQKNKFTTKSWGGAKKKRLGVGAQVQCAAWND